MPRRKTKVLTCRSCAKKKTSLSQKGNCKDCSEAKVFEANSQIKLKRGPIYEKYKKNLSAALEEM